MSKPALLALSDGTLFKGMSIGEQGQTVGELVFNTAMTGYQEILTDPSYAKQIITFTYPHIGNVGCNESDIESDKIWASGLVVRDLSRVTSNWRSQRSLNDFLKQQKIVGIAEIDTRALTHVLREKGSLNACISTDVTDTKSAVDLARKAPSLAGQDLARVVSTQDIYQWQDKNKTHVTDLYHVVVYDFGVKQTILRLLAECGCRITVVPANTGADNVLALKADGVFLSNGPGDPAACDYAIRAIQHLLGKNIPLFGICLGYQLLALACGAKSLKMKFGHHGANHPVSHMTSEHQVSITSQNHSFAIDENSLPDTLLATHRSLFDGSLQGIRHKEKPAFAVQGHPEASPGPHDMRGLFSEFIEMMDALKN